MTQKTPETISQLCKCIWELEERHALLDLSISGVLVWQASRMHLYYKLAEACGLYEQPHVTREKRSSGLVKLEFILRGLTVDNPFFNIQKSDIAVFDHSRSKSVENQMVDIYSYFLCKDLREADDDFLIFERPFLNQYQKDHIFDSRRIGIIDSIAGFLSNFHLGLMSSHDRKVTRQLAAELEQCFGVTLNLRTLFCQQIARFRIRRYLYGKLLDKYASKKVYLVVSYFLAPLIDSCKQRGIPVYELQHGVINKYHLGYSFPDRKPGTLQYFPDVLLEWGGRWPTTRYLPLDRAHIVNYGFKYFTANSARYAHLEKKPRKALIISQSVHGNSLAAFIRTNRAALEGWEISYKLHPSEFNRHGTYEDLKFLAQSIRDFTVIESADVHELLAESAVVIGVFSTALFEALEFQCKVFICPLAGWEYMDELLEQGVVRPFSEFPDA